MMETAILDLGLLLNVICVANRVHSPLFLGYGSPVKPSSTELLPLEASQLMGCASSVLRRDYTWTGRPLQVAKRC